MLPYKVQSCKTFVSLLISNLYTLFYFYPLDVAKESGIFFVQMLVRCFFLGVAVLTLQSITGLQSPLKRSA